jgi:hypothetical protein
MQDIWRARGVDTRGWRRGPAGEGRVGRGG